MYFRDGGYSSRQFNNAELRKTALQLAHKLPKLMQQTGAQAVAVTGKSGISLAFATLMLIDFPLIVVRKDGENTHGDRIEGTEGVNVQTYIVLDDFVSSGNTVRNIDDALDIYSSSTMRCVGVLEYCKDAEHFPPHLMVHTNHSGLVPRFGV